MKLLLNILRSLNTARDSQKRFVTLAAFGRWMFPSYIFSWNGYRWQDYKKFWAVIKKYQEDTSFNIHRRLMAAQLQRLTVNVSGDTAECGVYYGADSELILIGNAGTNKIHHVFDSFEGLSVPNETDKKAAYWKSGDMAVSEETVRENLKEFTNVVFYKGWIPTRFQEVSEKRFSFVHIDVDLEEPTKDSVEFFYPRMNTGGILVCDDYGFTTCPGATKAIDDFLQDKPEKMVSLPNGGGFFVKGTVTTPELLN